MAEQKKDLSLSSEHIDEIPVKAKESVGNGLGMTDEQYDTNEKSLVRKLDFTLLPMVWLLYFFNHLDRNNIAQARLSTFEQDLGLKGNQFNVAVPILSVGYMLMQLPSNMLLTRTRPSMYIPAWTALWSIVSAATAGAGTYTHLIVIRFFLGAMFLLSCWYPRKELALRTAILYSGVLLATAFSGLIAAGVLSGLEGAGSFMAAIVAFFVLPDFPGQKTGVMKWLLSDDEQKVAVERINRDRVSLPDADHGVFAGLMMAVTDFRTWVFVIMLTANHSAYGFNSFFPTIVNDRRKNRGYHIAIPQAVGVGFTISVATLNNAARYAAAFLYICGCFSSNAMVFSWASSTLNQTPEKRACATAIINLLSQLGNIWSPYFFPASDGPRYIKANLLMMAFSALSVATCVFMRFSLQKANKKLRESDDGINLFTLKPIDVESTLASLTLAEKISLLSGSDFWHSQAIPSHAISSIKCTDGPNGARGGRFFNPVPALCIPCGTGLGATWNPDLLYSAGQLLSRECDAKGAHIWLGPTVNLVRGPLNGRGFESFSEEPYLSGVLATEIIRGVQSRGTAAALKHFVANDQETAKMSTDICMSERALREVYLKPFQMAVRDAKPKIFMSSYNKVNGVHVSESKKLLKDILRSEWGFDGLVMSDWYGTYGCTDALNAGVDVEMPGPSRHRAEKALVAVVSGKVSRKTIDERARKVLELVNTTTSARVSTKESTRDSPEDRALNKRLATESIVLLKNSDSILPVTPKDYADVAIIGPNAKLAAACGGGSANLRPYYTSSVFQGISDQLPSKAKVHFEPGVFGHVLLPYFTGDNVTDENGKPGVSISFFNEPESAWQTRKPFDQQSIPDTTYQLMDYDHPEKGETFYMSMTAYYKPDLDGTYEFGLASYGVSRLYIDEQLVIDNATLQTHAGMFFGHGSREERGTYEMKAGETYRLRVEAGSASTSITTGGSFIPIPGGACRLGGCLKLDPEEGIRRAVGVAKKCKHTFVVVGLNADFEKEGKDRESMSLPPHVDDLVFAVLEAQPNAIVVTQAGNPIEMPWRHKAKAILHSWYGGNEAGNAVADIVFGKVNPSGKLPITFPNSLQDGPTFLSFGSDNGRIYYSEDVFVGHRWFDARGIEPAFEFGHGLSYTTFSTSNIRAAKDGIHIDVKNTGKRAGAEVVMLYISYDAAKSGQKSRFHRPVRTLAGFQKVFLEPGQETAAFMALDKYSTAVWDETSDSWLCEAGTYTASVRSSSDSLEVSFRVEKDIYWNGA
ncbi:beta-glucosidase [Fusarium subglutinans]|uniref:beta-glucosidase n=1 Tax=Gibberella subglutinans TaxID=42677 RepID=A0A8H5P6W6_GIBSU|nr:beta-glucosidase [Fusarium subglutinans]KAF5591141.1 beta-glucosidase [Fusarium subglutinans]